MSRRRLRLVTSSSDEDDASPSHQNLHSQQQDDTDYTMQEELTPEIILAEETLASTSLNPNPSYDFPSPPMEISDEEIVEDDVFIDVSDNLLPPSPDDPIPEEAFQSPPPAPTAQPHFYENLDSRSEQYSVAEEDFEAMQDDLREERDLGLIREVLSKLGLRLRIEWLTECLKGLERSVSGFGSFIVEKKAELCFGQFLLSDMNYSGAEVLPENVSGLHLEVLAGPFVLQVDEIVNISCPLRQRYQKAATGNKRCLKLSMTDGIHRVFGMEYRPIKDLDVLAPAGLKVAIRNVHVRHGLLMLVPEVIEILGGMAEELEAAHQRLVAEINKPPRGRRPRMGDILPLAARLTRAAWPSAVASVHESSRNSGPQNLGSMQTPVGVNAHDIHRLNESGAPSRRTGGGDIPNSASRHSSAPSGVRDEGYTPNPMLHTDAHATRTEQQHNSMTVDASTKEAQNTCPKEGATGSVRHQTHHFIPQRLISLHTSAGGAHEFDQAPHSGTQTEDVEMTNVGINRDGRAASYFSSEVNRETTDFSRVSNNFIDLEDIGMNGNVIETMVNSRPTAEMDLSSNLIDNPEDHIDHDDAEHPRMIPNNQEFPFTYLTSLSAELLAAEDNIASVKGKIKCFLTGVKIFQYQGRKSYELRAYVEDGSLISEILIDHSVVQDIIGYSPMEVVGAISSSDANTVSRMKEIMKQFRSFLMTFEGTMTVELRKNSPTPVAIEMKQGCPSSDTWLLLRRVKSYLAVQTPQNSEPIVLSP